MRRRKGARQYDRSAERPRDVNRDWLYAAGLLRTRRAGKTIASLTDRSSTVADIPPPWLPTSRVRRNVTFD